jgi:4,5-dihydroxyphthalate decarboxylase
MTAAVVVRGMLRRLYGVDVGSIRWVVGGKGARGQQQGEPLTGVSIDVVGQGVVLSEMLAQGAIDGLIALSPPPCFVDGNPQIERLFADTRAAEIECFRTSARFPIMHLIAIRRSLADDPALVSAVLSAFTAAKDYALSELGVTQASKVTLPWVAAAAQETEAVLGDDYWPYGVARNRAALAEFLNDAHQDRLTARRLAIEDLFHPATLTT